MQRQKVSGLLAAGAFFVLLSLAPAASASTLTIHLNPITKAAVMVSTSETKIVLTYPANSSMSKGLAGYSASSTESGNFQGGSPGIGALEGHFHDDDGSSVTISNMTVLAGYSAKANATALVISKVTNITATVTGVFSVVNGTVTADLGWRSFQIEGALDLPLQGHLVDVNLVGSSVNTAMGNRGSEALMFAGIFGGASIWAKPTLNFSSLSSPLTTWTKSYNSLTNTTTFSKTITGQSSLSASETFNGQTYSLKVTSDPSSVIATQGYADASGNSLAIVPTPMYLSPITWAEAGFLAALVGLAGYALVRSRRSRMTGGGSVAGAGPVLS